MSTENRLFRAYGQGCARSLLLRFVVAIVVVGGFACLAVVTALLPIEADYKVIVWGVLVMLFMFVSIAGVILWAVWWIRKRGNELDEVFEPLGLEGRGYLTNGRQYHGTFRGYPMHIYFYRGPTLQIYLDVPLRTRVGIGRKGAIARIAADMVKREVLSVDDPAFEHLVIYPDDRDWATALFADPQARAAILRLTNEDAATELRSLSVTPSALLWQTRYIPMRYIKPEAVRAWVDDLYELARIAQGLHPPGVVAVESSLERTTRSDRSKYTWPIVGITCGVIAIMTVCTTLISILFILLEESGL